jgi:hypothetical protein
VTQKVLKKHPQKYPEIDPGSELKSDPESAPKPTPEVPRKRPRKYPETDPGSELKSDPESARNRGFQVRSRDHPKIFSVRHYNPLYK